MEKPKNILLKTYRFPDKEPEQLGDVPDLNSGFLLETKWYDEIGNLIKQEEYDSDGQVTESNEFVFNHSGNIIEHAHFIGTELTEKLVIDYNEKGDVSREERVYQEGGMQRVEYAYNQDGKLVKKSITDEEGVEEGTEEFAYSGGNLMFRSVRDLLMETGEDFEMKYRLVGDKWELEEELHIDFPTGIKYRTVYFSDGYITYDGKGSKYASHRRVLNEKGLLKETHHSTMQREMSVYYTHDDDGKLAEEIRKVGENTNYRAIYLYNEAGLLRASHITEASSGMFTDLYLAVPSDQES